MHLKWIRFQSGFSRFSRFSRQNVVRSRQNHGFSRSLACEPIADMVTKISILVFTVFTVSSRQNVVRSQQISRFPTVTFFWTHISKSWFPQRVGSRRVKLCQIALQHDWFAANSRVRIVMIKRFDFQWFSSNRIVGKCQLLFFLHPWNPWSQLTGCRGKPPQDLQS